MPLKHDTETLLIVLLALALIVTGIVIAVLPPLPAGLAWWVLALIVALAYPFVLYPLLKSRRADYPFRALHFAPFVLLLVRFVLDLFSSFYSQVMPFAQWFGWGWAAPAVLIVFLLIALFCIRVLRQRDLRLRLLFLLFLPFLFLGLFSEWTGWNDRITAMIDGDQPPVIVAVDEPKPQPVAETGANLAPSLDTAEEKWRALLRKRQERQNQLQGSGTSLTVLAGIRGVRSTLALVTRSASSAVLPSSSSEGASSTVVAVADSKGSSSSKTPPKEVSPPHLVSAGAGPESIAFTLTALYCGVLHYRARKRRVA